MSKLEISRRADVAAGFLHRAATSIDRLLESRADSVRPRDRASTSSAAVYIGSHSRPLAHSSDRGRTQGTRHQACWALPAPRFAAVMRAHAMTSGIAKQVNPFSAGVRGVCASRGNLQHSGAPRSSGTRHGFIPTEGAGVGSPHSIFHPSHPRLSCRMPSYRPRIVLSGQYPRVT